MHAIPIQKKAIKQLGIPNKKISTIPMGVDEAFLSVGRNRKIEQDGRPFKILSNRNLLPIYNVSLLIRAIPIVLKEEPKTKFLIAGDGPERDHLEEEAKNLNLDASIKFLGSVPHDKMPMLLAEADIYVSTSFHDGTSVSLLEAMASGAYPVVTDILPNREWIVDGENGLLVPKENEVSLGMKIVEVIRNKNRLVEACERNRKIVEERSYWAENIKKIVDLYQPSR